MNRVIYGEAEGGGGNWLEFTVIYGIRSAIIVFGWDHLDPSEVSWIQSPASRISTQRSFLIMSSRLTVETRVQSHANSCGFMVEKVLFGVVLFLNTSVFFPVSIIP